MEKYIKNEAKFLLDTGLLFEINRLVLHKFGLALVVDVDLDNRKKVKIRGILETDDAEGWVFDDEVFEESKATFQEYMDGEGRDRIVKRKEALGYVIQGDRIGKLVDRLVEAVNGDSTDDLIEVANSVVPELKREVNR
jgi:hypothetical protein